MVFLVDGQCGEIYTEFSTVDVGGDRVVIKRFSTEVAGLPSEGVFRCEC
jgi:hypothetical protein